MQVEKKTPEIYREAAESHANEASANYSRAVLLEEECDYRGVEWRPSDTRHYLALLAKANYSQNAAILCRLRALELERGAGP